MQRVCIVSLDILGPIRNGGIGTAMIALAEALAARGHDVTVLYPPAYTETTPILTWILDYETKGIRLESLYCETSDDARTSYAAYQWLKVRHFDVIHFHDMQGVGYWSCQAKRMGLAFQNSTLVCQVHGQTMWHLENSSEFIAGEGQLKTDFLERKGVELADVIYSPSQYMIDDMLERGWAVPERRVVRPNLLPARFNEICRASERRELSGALAELVFFGRLETRKGLELFCDTLTLLDQQRTVPRQVTFLGKEGMCGTENATAYLARVSADWRFAFQVLTDLDVYAANAYLAGPGRLAIIASTMENSPYTVLECLAQATPFLASDVGGIRELIAPADQESAVFKREPRALASKIRRILAHGMRPIRPSVPFDENRHAWLDWHESLKPLRDRPKVALTRPLVSVCMSHFERPHLLEYAIRSIEKQTYDNIELVLVDDASRDDASKAYLDSLEPRFAARGWKLIRNSDEVWTGAARNQAVRAASGDYIMLMDDDNIALPEEIATFVTAARFTDADVLTCQIQYFEANTGGPPPFTTKTPLGWMPLGGDAALAVFENTLGDLNMFVRASVWRSLGGFTEDICGCEDYEFLYKVLLEGYSLACVPEILFFYRNSETQLASRYKPTHFYQSFNRYLRPLKGHVPPAVFPALLLASNRRHHAARLNRQGYWAQAEPRVQGGFGRYPLNSAQAITALSKLTEKRNQSESAALLKLQALRMSDGAADSIG